MLTTLISTSRTRNYRSTLMTYVDAEDEYPLYGHVTALAFSPDGNMFVTQSRIETNNNSGCPGTVSFWEAETRFGQNQCLKILRNFTAFSFNPDGNMLATASGNGVIELRNSVSVQSIDENKVTLKQKSGVHTLAFSPDSRILVGGSNDGPIEVWDTSTQQHITTLKGHSSVVSSVDFSPDGATLISESEDGTIRLWDTHTGQSETIFTEHFSRIRSIKFIPDGQTLMSRHGPRSDEQSDEQNERDRSSNDDTLHLWDVETGIRKATFTARSYYIGIAEFSPDSSTLAIWSKTGALELWDVETCLPKITFAEKAEEVTSIIFSPDGRVLVSWNDNSTVIWDVETGKRKVTLEEVTSIIFSPDGRVLVSWNNDSTVIWDVETGKRKVTLEGDGVGSVGSVHWSPNNRTLIGSSAGKADRYSSNERDIIRLWDLETGKRKVISTEDGKQKVKPILLSSDNSTLISVSIDESSDSYGYSRRNPTATIHLWDVETINCKTSFTDENLRNIESVLLSSDNRTFISFSKSSFDGCKIHLWDVETGKLKAACTEKLDDVQFIRLSSDNSTLISVSRKRDTYSYRNHSDIIHLWDVESGKLKATLEEGITNIESIRLSSDNSTLISISITATIHLWDVESGTCRATFTENIDEVTSVNLSPDGSTLILNQIYLWDVETGERKIDPIANITDIALSPDGNIIATGNDAGTILLWEISK